MPTGSQLKHREHQWRIRVAICLEWAIMPMS
jgi:hypothetical protein